jgi:hypothetical protein
MEKPSLLIGTPKRDDSPQMRRSHCAAISSPPPMQAPWISAIVGWRQSNTACKAAPACGVVDQRMIEGVAPGEELPDVAAGSERPAAVTAQDDAAHPSSQTDR